MRKQKEEPKAEPRVMRKTTRSVTVKEGDWWVTLTTEGDKLPTFSIYNMPMMMCVMGCDLDEWEMLKGMASRATQELVKEG